MKITPLSNVMGAEVTGVDLNKLSTAERDQLSRRKVLFAQWTRRFGVHNGQHVPAENPPHNQAIDFDRNDPILLVEN